MDENARRLFILCVDDDPDIRLIVELSLHLDPNIRALSVSGPAEALAKLAEGTFDLVLLDAMMPGMNGLELLDHIIRSDGSPPTPVIFLTADAQRRQRYDQPGVLGVITKPFDPIDLADRVRAIFAGAKTKVDQQH